MDEVLDASPEVFIRAEQPQDRPAIFQINAAAFPSDGEARLVDRLRTQAGPIISLVACEQERLLGHICFSRVRLEPSTGLNLMGLAPMAVLPEAQNRGIGSALVRAGLEACRQQQQHAIFVLGHPEYYPRFGFTKASTLGITSTYEAPEEAFLVHTFEPGILSGARGVLHYHQAFEALD